MSDTRSIHLGSGVDRDAALNEGTVVVDLGRLRVRAGATGQFFLADVADASFEELYRRHHADLAAAFARHAGEPGVFVAAVVPGYGLRAHGWLAADESMRAAIVGRHERADLHLPDDPALSLRHLAVLVRRDGERVRTRVFDLRTGTHFRDEAGRELAAVTADGPLFLRASVHRFFLLPTGAAAALPAWEALPARHFDDARTDAPAPARATAMPPAPPAMASAFLEERTVVTASAPLDAPEWLDLVAPGESPLGHLRVGAGERTAIVSLGAARASRGVLLGRYSRCDGVLPTRWIAEDVSRVHAFLLLEGGVLYVIDAGSTNGTHVRGRAVRCEPLPAGERVRLSTAWLIWDPAM